MSMSSKNPAKTPKPSGAELSIAALLRRQVAFLASTAAREQNEVIRATTRQLRAENLRLRELRAIQ